VKTAYFLFHRWQLKKARVFVLGRTLQPSIMFAGNPKSLSNKGNVLLGRLYLYSQTSDKTEKAFQEQTV
jgi:hypothetical protein